MKGMDFLVAVVQILTLAALVWYAWETRRARIEDAKFHRRERRIDYHFSIERFDSPTETDLIRYSGNVPKPRQCDAMATVANLGRPALLVHGIQLRIPSREDLAREYRVFVLPVPQGYMQQFIVADLIVKYVHETGKISEGPPADQRCWTGELEIALMFYSQGRMRQSEWLRYAVGISYDAVQTIHRWELPESRTPARTPSAFSKA